MKFTGFALLTMAAVGGAYFTYATLQAKENADATTATEGRLFEGLFDRVNEVRALAVTSGGETVTLERGEAGWGLAERGGYPVPFDKVKELVVQVAELEIDEPKTAKPENHAKLGVEDPTAEDATSSLLTLFGQGDAKLAELVVGDARRGGVFVRRQGEDQVWLCKGTLSIETTPKDWVETELMRIGGDRMEAVTIQHQDGEIVVVERSDEGTNQFRVQNVPDGKEEQYPGVANGVATALSYLQLDDVRPLDQVDLTDDLVANTNYRTTDGLVLDVRLGLVGEEHWITVEARYQDPTPEDAIGPVAADEGAESEGTEDAAAATEEAVRAEVEALRARLTGWAFRIVEYKADQIARRMDQLVQDPPAEENAVPDAPGAPLDGGGEAPFSLEDLLGQDPAAPVEPVVEDDAPSEEPPTEDAPTDGDTAPPADDSAPATDEADDPTGQDG